MSKPIYRLTYKNKGVVFVQAANLEDLKKNAHRQTPTKNIKSVHKMNTAGDGYIKVSNPFK